MPPKHVMRAYWYATVASICMVEFGYDGTLFSSVQVLPEWVKYFNKPSPPKVGAVNTAYSVAAVVMGFLISPLISDRLGRKWSIGAGSALIIIAGIVMTWAPNIGAFIGARAISGAGQGIAMPAGPVYIEEIVYAKRRGRFMSIWQIMYGVGNKIVTYIALGCVYSNLGVWQWRLVSIFQLFAPVCLLAFLWTCPESPRWYVQQNKPSKAREVLALVRLPEEIDAEMSEIENAVLYERERTRGSYKQLFVEKSYRYRMFLALIMNIGQQFSGIGSLTNYSGIVLKEVFPSSKTVILIKAIEAVIVTACPFIAFFFIDRMGRRPLFIWTAIGQAAVMLIIATVVTQTPPGPDGNPKLGVGIAVAILLVIFHVFYGPGWGAGVWIWTGEIWPLVVRANGVAIASQSQQVAGIVLGQAFPSFLKAAHFYTFYFFMGCNIALAVFVYFFIKETKGISLEHMDTLYGGEDHVVGGEEVAYDTVKHADSDGDVQRNENVHITRKT